MQQYNNEFNQEALKEQEIIKFINEFYITVRYKFLEYRNGIAYTVNKNEGRSWGLCDNDIKAHLQCKKTIGIYFPKNHTNIIGLDIDILDIDLLNKTYQTLINYGISNDSILISYSGSKGFHVDIFLSSMLDKAIINKFYDVLLQDVSTSNKTIELRGGNEQAYKLPLGIHYKTNNYCYVCNELGREVIELDLSKVKKLDKQIIADIVEINYTENIDTDLIIKFEEMQETILPLPIYQKTNENRIKQIEKLIATGVHEIGKRHISIREVAAYCKDIKGYCLAETMDFINDWVTNSWNKYIVDKEILSNMKSTIKSVYKTDFHFNVSANKITITLPEIREIFTIETGNKLQDEALYRLYYMFLVHSKAYAGTEGTFYLTYEQMIKMGATKDTSNLARQINKLEELGKLFILERNIKSKEGFKKKPNMYKLTQFISYENELKSFSICSNDELCKDCLYKALDYLAPAKERRKHVKGKSYKKLITCQYNKNT